MTSKVLAAVLCLVAAPAFAEGDLKTALVRLCSQIVSTRPTSDVLVARCIGSSTAGNDVFAPDRPRRFR
jgi:hypothetical protein